MLLASPEPSSKKLKSSFNSIATPKLLPLATPSLHHRRSNSQSLACPSSARKEPAFKVYLEPQSEKKETKPSGHRRMYSHNSTMSSFSTNKLDAVKNKFDTVVKDPLFFDDIHGAMPTMGSDKKQSIEAQANGFILHSKKDSTNAKIALRNISKFLMKQLFLTE